MKNHPSAILGSLLCATLLWAAACATANVPPLPDSLGGATAQIQSWVPLGTSALDAKKIMQQHGFSCTLDHDTRLSAEVVVDDLYCEMVWPATPSLEFPQRRWQAILFLKSDKVAGVVVRINLGGR